MKTINRRDFIAKTLLALSSTTISNSTLANQLVEVPVLSTNCKFHYECSIIYKEWKENEKDSPMTFLLKTVNSNVPSELKISELTKMDFQNKNFFSVNGLLLGKTEAAFLAILGSDIND